MRKEFKIILFTIACLLSFVVIGYADSAEMRAQIINPETYRDGTLIVDVQAELDPFPVGCGNSITGPFDAFTFDIPVGEGAISVLTYQTPDDLEHWCIAYAVRTDTGEVSLPSVVAHFVPGINPPVWSVETPLTFPAVISGTVDFTITIE